MPKPLTVELLQKEATGFAKAESKHPEPSLFGVTDGKAVGTTNLTLWGADDRVSTILDVTVSSDLSQLKEKLQEILPGENIRVIPIATPWERFSLDPNVSLNEPSARPGSGAGRKTSLSAKL